VKSGGPERDRTDDLMLAKHRWTSLISDAKTSKNPLKTAVLAINVRKNIETAHAAVSRVLLLNPAKGLWDICGHGFAIVRLTELLHLIGDGSARSLAATCIHARAFSRLRQVAVVA
jgi:hypothetical protein